MDTTQLRGMMDPIDVVGIPAAPITLYEYTVLLVDGCLVRFLGERLDDNGDIRNQLNRAVANGDLPVEVERTISIAGWTCKILGTFVPQLEMLGT